MASIIGSLLVVFTASQLFACSSSPVHRQDFRDTRMNLAVSLEQQGRYADALLQWQALQLVFPEDSTIAQQIHILQQKIRQGLLELREQLAHSDKHTGQTRQLYLKMLALQPDHAEAREGLRNFERRVVGQAADSKAEKIKKIYAAKKRGLSRDSGISRYLEQADRLYQEGSNRELLQLTEEFLQRHPDNMEGLGYRFRVLVSMAEEQAGLQQREEAVRLFEQALATPGTYLQLEAVRKHYHQLTRSLSTEYYRKGIRHFSHDIERAISHLQTSLEYDSGNVKARQQLERALKIQKNLRLIKGAG